MRGLTCALLVLLSLCVYGCGISEPTATSAPTALKDLFPELADLPAQAQSFSIKDNWNGYNAVAPVVANFNASRAGDKYQGSADFSSGYDPNVHQATAAITIPSEVVLQAAELMVSAKVQEGQYVASTMVDYYPDVAITINAANSSIGFFTTTGPGWGLSYKGKSFVLQTNEPGQAIALLNPYLARDVQEKVGCPPSGCN